MKTGFFILILSILIYHTANSQTRIYIEGVVSDASNGDPLPFTNIHFAGSPSGTITLPDGSFSVSTDLVPDTMIVSAVGYEKKMIPIRSYENQNINVSLHAVDIELLEVLITPGENPAIRIIKNVIDEKENNNPMKAASIACNTYTKIMVNALNDRKSDSLNGNKKEVPVYFSEKLSQNLIQQDPYLEKGQILAEKQDGLGFLNELSIIGYSNNLSLGYNFYDNVVEILDKPFISPLNSRGFMFYRYYLEDSITSSFGKEYLISFKPRNERDLAFTGHMKVIDEVWSLSEISLSIPETANLNYVNRLKIYQSFQEVNDSLTFFHINDTEAELKLTKEQAFAGIDFTARVKKRSVYSDVLLNFQTVREGSEAQIWQQIDPRKELRSEKNMLSLLRPESLSQNEISALSTIDSLNNDWRIKSADALSKMFITGYIPGNIIDLGPFLELVKYNKIEDYRYTFSARTSADFTKNAMFYGHVGYGTGDNEWKYGGGLQFKPKADLRRLITLEYRNDLSRIGDNRSIFLIKENMMVSGEDNVIASIFTNSPLDKLSREERFSIAYEHEWKTGLTTYSGFDRKTIQSGIYLPFIHGGNPLEQFTINEAMLGLRLSWQENFTDNYCRRYYLTTRYPIINLRIRAGQYQLEELENNYLTARAVINHDVNFGQTKFEYVIETGLTLGDVPFPMLEVSRSDQSLGYALYSFNMVNEMEFVSDRFASIMAQYHLNGLVFNRLPLLKQLGIREVFSGKVLWSHLGSGHSQILQLPDNTFDARMPYVELSAGIENFFQYFRFDLVWRMNYLDHPGVNPIGIRARFDVNF